jgi:nitrite reductase/ring-hydroxylating ferredoxin subunit
MEIDRRVVVTGALALSAAAIIGMPAHANELNLGSSNSIKVGSSKIFSSGSNRILVHRQSAAKFLAYRAICPNDSKVFTSANIKGTRVTCASDKRAFSLVTGRATSGTQKLEPIKLRVSQGFLLATVSTATPSATATPSPTSGNGPLIARDKVPVGSGVRVISSTGTLMIVQPKAGVYKAFSAVCTHAGCEVSEVTASQMVCTCHDSAFSTADGAVLQGPARQGLRQFDLVERDGSLFLN